MDTTLRLARHAFVPTQSDTVNLTSRGSTSGALKGLFIGGAGNVKVRMADGVDVTFTGVAAGTLLPIQVVRVWSTGTTATNIVALA